MIVWLASYPRSGNLLTRQILARAFGCLSASEYPEGGDELAAQLGVTFRLPYDGSAEDLIAAARASPDRVFIKTHGPPRDDSPAIYILRDGRAAVVSYRHFLGDSEGLHDLSLAQVIRGEVGFGSWSGHLDAWSPLLRPRTLVLRFETLRRQPQDAIAAIERFIARPATAAWVNPFERLQRAVPTFFRHGDDRPNFAELAGPDLGLFWAHHGAWMTRLGYGEPPPG
jgi:hypothetical protein